MSRGQLCSIISYGLVEIPLCVSGQDGVILPARDCPFCSRNKISPKSKRVHETVSFHKTFSVAVKRFDDKSESVNKNKTKESKNIDDFQEYI